MRQTPEHVMGKNKEEKVLSQAISCSEGHTKRGQLYKSNKQKDFKNYFK
jgi:hypothetical protein